MHDKRIKMKCQYLIIHSIHGQKKKKIGICGHKKQIKKKNVQNSSKTERNSYY